MDDKEKALEELYYSPHTGFKSANHLWEQAQEKYSDLDISLYFVKRWLLKQNTYTRFKTSKRPKHFRHTIVRDFYQMQFDLAEMATRVTKEGKKEKDLEANEGNKYILVGVEILSRYGWAIPQKTKGGKETAANMKIILDDFEKRFGRKLEIIQFDEGAEFENKDVLPLLAKEEIKQWKVKTPRKAAIVERLIRTIKAKLWKMFYANKNRIWYDKIEDVIENYNNTPHRSIGMKPKDVNEDNKYTVWGRLYGHEVNFENPKFSVGDRVRVLHLVKRNRAIQIGKPLTLKLQKKHGLTKLPDEKVKIRAEPPFSEDIFEITKVLLGDPVVYKLRTEEFDYELGGIFYEQELSLVRK